MVNGQPRILADPEITVRIIDTVVYISVFQVISDLQHRHHRTVVLRLLCRSAKMRNNQTVIMSRHDGIGKIRDIFRYFSGIDAGENGMFVHQKVS